MPNYTGVPRGAFLWTQQDISLYNRLPIYMAKMQVDMLKWYGRWTKIFNKIKWQANMGFTMQGVHKNPSPILRSQFFPEKLSHQPRKDVIEVRESKEQCVLYRHNYESQLFHFLPSFVDFLTDSIDVTNADITEKIAVGNDLFHRTAAFHGSDVVYLCGRTAGELVTAPFWTSPEISEVKNAGWLASVLPSVTRTLDLANIQKIGQVMYSDLGSSPFSGSVLADGTDGKGLRDKYCLICGREVWDNFINDTFLQGNRQLNLDIVTDAFTGSLFGRWTTMHERYELRIAADGTTPAPEIVEEGPDRFDLGEVKPNPAYVSAPWAVAFGCGADAYKAINVGPPPSDFTGMTMEQFAKLDWNGKVMMTKNVLVNTTDQNGAIIQDTNKRGEYLQLLGDAVMGNLPMRRRNLVPIIYRRARVGA